MIRGLLGLMLPTVYNKHFGVSLNVRYALRMSIWVVIVLTLVDDHSDASYYQADAYIKMKIRY